MKKKNVFFIALLFCSFLGLWGCDKFNIASTWKDREITVDGNDTEWQDRMTQQGAIYLGVSNDAEYLYLCLGATDKKTKAQLMGLFRQNLSIWFDPEGKKRKTFGLRFSNESPMMDESLVSKIKLFKTPMFQLVANEMMSHWEIEVLNNDYPVALLADAPGIDVSAGIAMRGRKLTYELKVPLVKSEKHPYAIGAVPGKIISIGMETSPIDMGFMRKQFERYSYEMEKSGHSSRWMEYNFDQGGTEDWPTMAMMLDDPIAYVQVWGKIKLAVDTTAAGVTK